MNSKRGIYLFLVLMAMPLFAGDPPTPTHYTVTDLGVLGGCCTFAYSINNKGQITGWGLNSASANRGFFWQNGTMIDLGSLNGRSSYAFAIDDSGQIVGGSDASGTSGNAFVWQDGVMRELDDHPNTYGFTSAALGINAFGVAVGQGQRGDGIPAPVVFSGGAVTKLPTPALDGNGNPYSVGSALAINDGGQIVGYGDRVARANAGPVPLLWQGGSYLRLGSLNANDEQGEALAINAAGQIVGWSVAANGRPHAFLWQNGTMADLGGLRGGTDSTAYGINSAGVIVGQALDLCPGAPCGPDTAFVYENGVMYDLQDLIPSDSGVKLQTATAINDSGQIVVNNGVRAYLLTPVVIADTTPPAISCNASDGHWHSGDISIVCTASDSGSGLADAGEASFLLSTSVAAGVEDANAQTNSRQICDKAGNCATAGPIGGNMIDKRPPSIAVATPTANAAYLLNQLIAASYACSDGGSGVVNCTGSIANGASLDTLSVGTRSFSVTANDAVGNTSSQSLTFTVSFAVFALSDPTRAENNVKVELELRDANGVNVSSPSIVLTVQSIDSTMPLSGTFTYTKARSGAYKYDVPRDVSSGAHTLYFTASGDPAIHGVAFTAR